MDIKTMVRDGEIYVLTGGLWNSVPSGVSVHDTTIRGVLNTANIGYVCREFIPQINKVIYDIPNNTTIVYFVDGTKEIARVADGDAFDKEVGILQCIAKKMYGSRSRWLKDVVDKGIEVKPRKERKGDLS